MDHNLLYYNLLYHILLLSEPSVLHIAVIAMYCNPILSPRCTAPPSQLDLPQETKAPPHSYPTPAHT